MPRKKVFQNRAFIGFIIEGYYADLLEQLARREGISKSELCRRIIVEWLEGEAKVKYGLQLAPPPQAEKADAPRMLPLVKKKLDDVESALREVEPVIDRLARKLPTLVEMARRLAAERRQVEEWRAQKATLRVGGREVPAEKYYWEWRARADGALKLLAGALEEWKGARAKFFKVVYYPWLKYLRREVPPEVLAAYEDRIAALLEKIDRAEPFARELERLLRPERLQPGAGRRRGR
jgi:hypothetical protein